MLLEGKLVHQAKESCLVSHHFSPGSAGSGPAPLRHAWALCTGIAKTLRLSIGRMILDVRFANHNFPLRLPPGQRIWRHLGSLTVALPHGVKGNFAFPMAPSFAPSLIHVRKPVVSLVYFPR